MDFCSLVHYLELSKKRNLLEDEGGRFDSGNYSSILTGTLLHASAMEMSCQVPPGPAAMSSDWPEAADFSDVLYLMEIGRS